MATPSAAFSLLPPIFPCVSWLPRIPLLPCVEPEPFPAEATDCLPHVMKMVPACTGFLTNSSVTAPPSTCCDGYHAVLDNGGGICYCHMVNRDIQKLLPAPMNVTRMLSLPEDCGLGYTLDALAKNCGSFDVPPMTTPSPPAGKATPPAAV
ncbi:hypothetical protein HU200_052195 [Digitaria exilis]|uniref:Bifunctional inhibitor/plant lipid transfer protein/seed storage helical domain-containing protein n=1 Tax=Digitaria exilis TaxID=1010633 RepID=A0A835AR51_9POAL|nr:hypothetical protein HU200_052195 [Digitaria exilis]CAB3455200.1 unnamed protein product [Digitaria exilis]